MTSPLNAVPLPTADKDEWLKKDVPYRVVILGGLKTYNAYGGPNGILRPAFECIFEANLSACRWVMGLLGVRLVSGSLAPVVERKDDDVYSIDLGGTFMEPTLLSAEDRDLLATVYKGANKASAHPVQKNKHTMKPEDVEPASILLIEGLRKHLYTAQGLTPPF